MQWTRPFTRLASWSPTIALLAVFSGGVIFWGGFNWSLELTNTESFCISCHEMEQYVYQEYRKSVHYSNRTGIRATCPDCHVPKEWNQKVIRKIQATNELYQWLRGSIDTREKFEAKRFELASHVWESMRETDSQECRNCHQRDHMAVDKQIPEARKMHQLGELLGNTCIECHQGIAHELADEFDKEMIIDQMHHRIEELEMPCRECHEQLNTPAYDEEW